LKISKGGNQNPYIEEEQTAQWPKEKGTNNNLQNNTQQTTKDRVILIPLRTVDDAAEE
jgi:hypothetical protein